MLSSFFYVWRRFLNGGLALYLVLDYNTSYTRINIHLTQYYYDFFVDITQDVERIKKWENLMQ